MCLLKDLKPMLNILIIFGLCPFLINKNRVTCSLPSLLYSLCFFLLMFICLNYALYDTYFSDDRPMDEVFTKTSQISRKTQNVLLAFIYIASIVYLTKRRRTHAKFLNRFNETTERLEKCIPAVKVPKTSFKISILILLLYLILNIYGPFVSSMKITSEIFAFHLIYIWVLAIILLTVIYIYHIGNILLSYLSAIS